MNSNEVKSSTRPARPPARPPAPTFCPSGLQSQRSRFFSKVCTWPANTLVQRLAGAYGRMSHTLQGRADARGRQRLGCQKQRQRQRGYVYTLEGGLAG